MPADAVQPALPARVNHVARAAEGRGIRVRRLDPRRLSAEAEVIRLIYNAAWAENWGALPMTSGEASTLASRLRPSVPRWVRQSVPLKLL